MEHMCNRGIRRPPAEMSVSSRTPAGGAVGTKPMKSDNLNVLLARRNELVASLDASRAAFRAFEKTQIEAVARADADLSAALKTQPEATK